MVWRGRNNLYKTITTEHRYSLVPPHRLCDHDFRIRDKQGGTHETFDGFGLCGFDVPGYDAGRGRRRRGAGAADGYRREIAGRGQPVFVPGELLVLGKDGLYLYDSATGDTRAGARRGDLPMVHAVASDGERAIGVSLIDFVAQRLDVDAGVVAGAQLVQLSRDPVAEEEEDGLQPEHLELMGNTPRATSKSAIACISVVFPHLRMPVRILITGLSINGWMRSRYCVRSTIPLTPFVSSLIATNARVNTLSVITDRNGMIAIIIDYKR